MAEADPSSPATLPANDRPNSNPRPTGRPALGMPEGGFDEETTRSFLEAMSDPLRRRILMALGGDEGLTIRQVATILGEPPRRIRHQVDVLATRGLVGVESERPHRGTIERTFRTVEMPPLGDEAWRDLEPGEVKLFLLDTLRFTVDEISEAISAGTFVDRDGWCAARVRRRVDGRGWDELAALQERALHDALSIMDAARERLEESGEAPVRTTVSLFLFEVPDP